MVLMHWPESMKTKLVHRHFLYIDSLLIFSLTPNKLDFTVLISVTMNQQLSEQVQQQLDIKTSIKEVVLKGSMVLLCWVHPAFAQCQVGKDPAPPETPFWDKAVESKC